MGKKRFYCEYCDIYLTHDSLEARRQHSRGWKHKTNVRAYYSQLLEQQGAQMLVSSNVNVHPYNGAAGTAVAAGRIAPPPPLPIPPPSAFGGSAPPPVPVFVAGGGSASLSQPSPAPQQQQQQQRQDSGPPGEERPPGL